MRIDSENMVVIRMSEEEATALHLDLDHKDVEWDSEVHLTLNTFFEELSEAV